MFFFQNTGPNQKIPITTKVTMILWILISLGILSFFAFSFFIIALLAGVVIFTANLFQKNRAPISNKSNFNTRPYTQNQKQKDDDIIDI